MSTAPDEVVLLTGYPSSFARVLLRELLTQGHPATVKALVRKESRKVAEAYLSDLPEHYRTRVEVVEGDVTYIDFGLAGSEYRSLARVVDRVHHAAEVTHPGASRRLAESVNIDGTREVLEFAALAGHLERLVVHSTTQVLADDTGRVSESDLGRGQGFRNIYEETKARAETLVRAAMPRLPVTVVRKAMLTGDSVTGDIGESEPFAFVIAIFLLSAPHLVLPMPRRSGTPVPLVPADYAARASVHIGRSAHSRGGIYHLVDPDPPTAHGLLCMLAQATGRPSPSSSLPAVLTRLVRRPPSIERLPGSARATLETLVRPVVYETAPAAALLEGTGIRCPTVASYLRNVVLHVDRAIRSRRGKRDGARAVEG